MASPVVITIVSVTTISLVFAFIIIFIRNAKKIPSKDIEPKDYRRKMANFKIHNNLPKSSIKVFIKDEKGERVEIAVVKPKGTEGVPREDVLKYLIGGSIIEIHVSKGDGWVHYTDYLIDIARDERIKRLYVGMITSRFIGGSMDSLHMPTTFANASQGNAFVVFHNPTYIPLRLNDDIVIEPHSTSRYLGEMHQGVTLGTYFKDPDGLYDTYQYLRPYNNIYYGVVSDVNQPLNGCWQQEYNDNCEYGQTLWPFEEGVL